MSLTPISLFTLSLLLLLLLPFTATSSLHNLLQSQGLPAGLFPNTVKSYNLDPMGRLEVHLDSSCMAKFENRVYFDNTVRANLSFGGLKGLEGLIQEELFLWLPVKGISLSLSLFEDPPLCNPQGVSVKEDVVKSNELQAQR
ncbi:hypothetical protein M0R45_002492 [Rubus argutus]|uniref:Transmembrane protein n=1 Tax=Rubus argutus TaxID=59490 RepID=A0AAW1VNQ4_RUBAR